jgi:Flp pilus assembly protein TadG
MSQKLLGSISTLSHDEAGAAVAEFAIVSVVVLLLVIGSIEFGLAMWQRNTTASDARDGARYAIVRGANSGHIATQDSVANYVKNRTSLDTAAVRVHVSWTPDNKPGSVVVVSVAHSVPRQGLVVPARTDSATSRMTITN